MKICINCGNKNPNRAMFCCFCGKEDFFDIKAQKKGISREDLARVRNFVEENKRKNYFLSSAEFNNGNVVWEDFEKKSGSFLAKYPILTTSTLIFFEAEKIFKKVLSWMKKTKKKHPEILFYAEISWRDWSVSKVSAILPVGKYFFKVAELNIFRNGEMDFKQVKAILPLLEDPSSILLSLRMDLEKYEEEVKRAKKKIYFSRKAIVELNKHTKEEALV